MSQFTGASPATWSDRIHDYIQTGVKSLVAAVIAAAILYVQTHPFPTPVVQTAPVPVVNVTPPKLTLAEVMTRLEK